MHFRGIDWGISWFDGYDPMPGIALTSFNLDFSGSSPVPTTLLSVRPYKIKVIGLDFESSPGAFGLRGEAALSIPYLSSKTSEYVPSEELKWVAGAEWSPGNWRFTGEYSGKYIPGFVPSAAPPLFGTETDNSQLAELLSIPGFDITEYVRQQVGSFNRLYNYQLKRYYHSAGIRIETNLLYDRIAPSVFAMYNFTTAELLIFPEIRYKPADEITIVAGAEIYTGNKGSLFDIIHDFMNTIYVALKVDF
jgi:hypothetical protein